MVGDRIELVFTDDPWTDLKPGDRGTVTYDGAESQYGDKNQIGVKWDSGSTLGLIRGHDQWRRVDDGDAPRV